MSSIPVGFERNRETMKMLNGSRGIFRRNKLGYSLPKETPYDESAAAATPADAYGAYVGAGNVEHALAIVFTTMLTDATETPSVSCLFVLRVKHHSPILHNQRTPSMPRKLLPILCCGYALILKAPMHP